MSKATMNEATLHHLMLQMQKERHEEAWQSAMEWDTRVEGLLGLLLSVFEDFGFERMLEPGTAEQFKMRALREAEKASFMAKILTELSKYGEAMAKVPQEEP